ncbi:unnamed protein product [Colias eurytheme]|nr:unnamed protein product [Colias eurytheme]
MNEEQIRLILEEAGPDTDYEDENDSEVEDHVEEREENRIPNKKVIQTDNIRRVIADIRPQMLEKVVENWTSRLDYVRASRGGHMPEVIFKL